MARIICVANQKGGVGKTTTSVNLAAALVELGHRVMIVDMDPQGNASSGLGVKRYVNQENNIYQVLIGEKPIAEAIQATNVSNLDIIPANPDLVGAEIELVDMPNREYRLRSCLAEVSEIYKYILIDCPPSLGLLTVNSLSAAETFLVPLQCEYYALEGLSQLLNTAGLIKKSLNQELRIEGIVLTMFDARNNLSHQVVAEIQSHFGEKVFAAIIPRNVRLSEAPSHGQTIFQYDPKSPGAKRYRELAQELDQRVHGSASPRPQTTAAPPTNHPSSAEANAPTEISAAEVITQTMPDFIEAQPQTLTELEIATVPQEPTPNPEIFAMEASPSKTPDEKPDGAPKPEIENPNPASTPEIDNPSAAPQPEADQPTSSPPEYKPDTTPEYTPEPSPDVGTPEGGLNV